jgi:hypothetical protein
MTQSATRTAATCLAASVNDLADKFGKKPIDPPQPIEAMVSFTLLDRLDDRIAPARREMGEERWAQLQAEWNAK